MSIPKCVVLVDEELHALADFPSFLLGAFCRAVQCSIVRESFLHLPQVCLPEIPAVLRILLVVASGSCSREARCLDELLEVAAYDFRKSVVETPSLERLAKLCQRTVFYIHVTPTLNPSPRGRDFVGPKALLKRCFALRNSYHLFSLKRLSPQTPS